MSRRLLVPLLVLPVVCVTALCAATDSEEPISRRTLPNGLHLTAVHDPLTDIAAFHLALDLSPADIPQDEAGIREIVQQLVLDELRLALSDDGKLSSIRDAIEAGGSISVSADTEYVEAQASLPSEMLPTALETVADMLFGPQQFTDQQLAAAKAKVVNAYERSLHAAADQTYRLFRRALLGKSPLTQDLSVILTGVAAIRPSDIAACRESFYVPARAYLTVVSPLSDQEMVALVERVFGQYQGGTEAAIVRDVRPLAESAVRVGSGKDLAQASLIIGVPLPPYGTRGFVAGQVAYMLLAGKGGRVSSDPMLRQGFGLILPRAMLEQRPPFEVIPPSPMSVPFIGVHIVANPDYIEDARIQVLGHVGAIRRGEFTDQELQSAKDQLINQYALAGKTYLARAQLVNLNALFGGDPQLASDFPAAVASITADDVVKVAAEQFAHHAIGVQMPAN